MKKNIAKLVVAVVATLTISAAANAQQQNLTQTEQNQTGPTQGQFFVSPLQIQPPQQNQYYFGMRLELNRGFNGTTLRIADVTWGSPAQRAGLEVGDEIRMVNGRGFQNASNSFDAVAMMNRFVDNNNGAPAVAASAQGVQACYIAPPTRRSTAQMVVRNVRNGQDVYVTVRPERRGFGGEFGPAPAAAASVAIR